MIEEDVMLARVEMPERGLFTVRMPDPPEPAPKVGDEAVVNLDYGEDFCRVVDTAFYDPMRHGPRVPGFQVVRMLGERDRVTIQENRRLAGSMADMVARSAAPNVPGLRIGYSRLSLGRTRLFLRFSADAQRVDLRRHCGEVKRAYGVLVEAWQMGPRDEASSVGCLGVCGRVACCASWQRRFPTGLGPELARRQGLPQNPSSLNGTCGRFKCCLAFECGDCKEEIR